MQPQSNLWSWNVTVNGQVHNFGSFRDAYKFAVDNKSKRAIKWQPKQPSK
jgi:hypothetical protein